MDNKSICKVLVVLSFSGLLICYISKLKVPPSLLQVFTDQGMKTSNQVNETEESSTIFFIESSESSWLNLRQTCSVEAAARLHPGLQVKLLTTAPISNRFPHIRCLNDIPNVHFENINISHVFLDTPFYEFYRNGTLDNCVHRTAFLSDALRLAVLWKYGGVYLDLDVVTVKPILNLRNTAALHLNNNSQFTINNCALIFDRRSEYLLHCMMEFVQHFNKSDRAANGPKLFTNVYKRFCINGNASFCKNITILDRYAFSSNSIVSKLFIPFQTRSYLMELLNSSYTFHAYNHITSLIPVVKGLGQGYDILAKIYCPCVYSKLYPFISLF